MPGLVGQRRESAPQVVCGWCAPIGAHDENGVDSGGHDVVSLGASYHRDLVYAPLTAGPDLPVLPDAAMLPLLSRRDASACGVRVR